MSKALLTIPVQTEDMIDLLSLAGDFTSDAMIHVDSTGLSIRFIDPAGIIIAESRIEALTDDKTLDLGISVDKTLKFLRKLKSMKIDEVLISIEDNVVYLRSGKATFSSPLISDVKSPKLPSLEKLSLPTRFLTSGDELKPIVESLGSINQEIKLQASSSGVFLTSGDKSSGETGLVNLTGIVDGPEGHGTYSVSYLRPIVEVARGADVDIRLGVNMPVMFSIKRGAFSATAFVAPLIVDE